MVSGLAATGKSTLCEMLGKKLGLRVYSGGEMLLSIAKDFGYKARGLEWWDTEEGMSFLDRRKNDLSIDRMVDEKLKEIARRESAVMDTWVLPWLVDEGFKIWLKADIRTRAERLMKRSPMSMEKAMEVIKERDEENRRLYRALYDIDLGKDMSPFHLVLDTSKLTSESVFKIAYAAVVEFYQL